jgi:GTPase SAR1 family protein
MFWKLCSSVTAYYRGAMGILLVYDVTDEQSFQNIRNWIRTLEQHAADNVDKILIGNKCDVEDKAIETERGQRLAAEYKINFFETSAKSNINVNEAFYSIATDIKKRLVDNPSAQSNNKNNVRVDSTNVSNEKKSKCCGGGN